MTTEEETRAIVRATVQETLLALGIDMSEPLEAQKDFQHLRAWRESVDTIKRQGLVAAVGVIVTGLIGAILLSFKVH